MTERNVCMSDAEVSSILLKQAKEGVMTKDHAEAARLRAKARDLRQAAMYAERREDARSELSEAARLEAEADRLDGIVRAPKGKPLTKQQVEENHRAVMAKGRAALEQFFSRDKA